MQTRSWRLLMIYLALLLLVGSLSHAGVAAQSTSPGGTVEPASGTVGTTFTFSFAGWNPGEVIEYWVIGAGENQAPFEEGEFINMPDAEGRTTWLWTAPEGAWTGRWTMNARGLDSYLSVQITFDLAAPPLPTSNSGVNPQRGTAGTRFSFFSDAWPQGDVVDLWVLPPGRQDPFWLGRIYGDPKADPGNQGRTFWEWVAPDNIWGGTWTMNGRGYWSEKSVQIAFELEGPPPPEGPSASVTPAEAYPGTTLTFQANGYGDIEPIVYWVNAPGQLTPVDGNSVGDLYSNVAGEASWQWTIPPDAQPGRWSLVARGNRTALEHTIAFTVLSNGPGGGDVTTTTGAVVEPASGPPGTRFYFSAIGFSRNEKIQYWATDPAGATFSDNAGVFADEEGNIAFSWLSPPDALNGRWTMLMRGEFSVTTLTVEFTISGAPQDIAPPYSVSPAAGRPGTTFQFIAEGFGHDEKAGWWATAPDGRIFPGGVDQMANQQGRLAWQWTAPADAMAGRWMMVVQGRTSNLEYAIPFEIRLTLPDETPAPAPPPQVTPTPAPPPETSSVVPSSGPPGTTFTFRMAGFLPHEAVGYWVTAPDGTIYAAPDVELVNPRANEDGIVSLTWTAPADAMPGQWLMVVQSSTASNNLGNNEAVVPFVIEFS